MKTTTRIAALLLLGAAWSPAADAADGDGSASYARDVRPLFQAHCHGCHQPAKDKGDYVMTDFAALLAGGESGDPAVVPGKPEESVLMDLIVPREGVAEMPKKKPPLHETEIDLVRRWIAAGAVDDRPPGTERAYSPANPPVYKRPPVITALDVSPDGNLLAVSGFHETLLLRIEKDGLTPEARFIGESERVESLAFSPDGGQLLVVGGNPGRMGELQIWDLAKRELRLSQAVTFDTAYGASWSPDGSRVAVGGADSSVRVFGAGSGTQVFYNAGHDDWALDTVFSKDGDHLVSVGRDMSVKLYEIATERFIDNITSITPGALKGGVNAVARRPGRDEVVVGGADGVPKLYRMFRVKKREIGDDSNLLLEFPPLPGRIFDLAIHTNGARVVAVSSLDGVGTARVFDVPADLKTPKEVSDVLLKPVHKRSGGERDRLGKWFAEQVAPRAEVTIDTGGLYAAALSPDGDTAYIGGADGLVRQVDIASGEIRFSVSPVALARQ